MMGFIEAPHYAPRDVILEIKMFQRGRVVRVDGAPQGAGSAASDKGNDAEHWRNLRFASALRGSHRVRPRPALRRLFCDFGHSLGEFRPRAVRARDEAIVRPERRSRVGHNKVNADRI